MTDETTEPQQMGLDLGADGAAAQPGQAPGHRRRRRRRSKGKAGSATAQQNPNSQQPQPQPQPQPQSQNPAPPQGQNGTQQKQQGGGGRRKKKFFKGQNGSGSGGGSNGQNANPGNSIYPSQGKKKARQQKGPRQFVGPMDHSYRVANGNVADSPGSTIQMNGSGHASYSSVDLYEPVVPVPVIDENAAPRIICFIEDLFFLAKIQETARKLGVKVSFVKGADKDAISQMTDATEEQRPALVVFDLNNANAKPLTLIPKLKTKLKRGTSIIGFLSHLQGDLKMKAIEAGCDTVMPRSAFSQSLPNLLRRYGAVDEEEDYPQPA